MKAGQIKGAQMKKKRRIIVSLIVLAIAVFIGRGVLSAARSFSTQEKPIPTTRVERGVLRVAVRSRDPDGGRLRRGQIDAIRIGERQAQGRPGASDQTGREEPELEERVRESRASPHRGDVKTEPQRGDV